MKSSVGARSVLFVPGNMPHLIRKCVRWHADLVVVDLEDAVAPDQKVIGRDAAAAAIAETVPTLASACFVRLNESAAPWHDEDVEMAASLDIAGVVLPKLERPEELEQLRSTLADLGRADLEVIVGLESALGVADSRLLLEAKPNAAYFGAEDLIADLGGRRTPSNEEVLYARSTVAISARISGVYVIDQAVLDFGDDERFVRDAKQGQALGYGGKICIHPRQVELSAAVYSVSPEAVAHAKRVLEAAAVGVATVDGQMVDEVHVKMARQVLARHHRDS